MCKYCNIPVYIKATKYAKSLTAPLTKAEELQQQLEDLTGEVYLQLPNNFCPMCGEPVEFGLKEKPQKGE